MSSDTAIDPHPGDEALEARARAAGVDLDALTELERIRKLREFLTPAELDAIVSLTRARLKEDARIYNEMIERDGLWNEDFRPW